MSTESGKTRLAYALLALLALLHIVLAITYAVITPYRTPGYLAVFKSVPFQPNRLTGKLELVWQPNQDIGAPDEIAHSNFAVDLIAGRGLPVVRPDVPDPGHPGHTIRNPNLREHYEDHQAPLYYILTAGFAKLIGIDASAAIDPVHGYPLRFLNSLIGATTVAGVFFLALWGLGRRDVAILAAGITALLPMNLALSGAMSNDPLLFALCTWTLALCALGLTSGWTVTNTLITGILVGLALLTKTTALALLPIVAFAFVLRRPSFIQVTATFITGLAISMPWFMRNQSLYGDPLGLKIFKRLFADEITTPQFIAQVSGTPLNHWFNYVAWFTARSFYGVFGYMDIFLNERGVAYTGPATQYGAAAPNTLYRVLMALTAVAALGFVMYMTTAPARKSARVHLLNAVFLILILLSFIAYNLTFFQGQARYFYPAIGPIAIGLALGAIYLAKSKRNWVIGAIVALLLILNAYALVRLPGEFAKRMNPTLANQTGALFHPKSEGGWGETRLNDAPRRQEELSA